MAALFGAIPGPSAPIKQAMASKQFKSIYLDEICCPCLMERENDCRSVAPLDRYSGIYRIGFPASLCENPMNPTRSVNWLWTGIRWTVCVLDKESSAYDGPAIRAG